MYGETIRAIAARYHLNALTLARWNQLAPPYRVHVDGILRLTPPSSRLTAFATRVELPGDEDMNYRKGCPVSRTDLRKVWVSYIDFSGVTRHGFVVVHRAVAAKAQRVFHQLYNARFRIQAMLPLAVNAPWAPDESVATMAYNCRKMTSGSSYSRHSYGIAIDVNPWQNPYISHGTVVPATSSAYKVRSTYRLGVVHATGRVVRAFAHEGFKWGGNWHSLKDYMHFSTDGR
jgi:hypothetical protein